jgi:dihydroorotate dehydrogenase
MIYSLFRTLLFQLPPERAHALVLDGLDKFACLAPPIKHPPSKGVHVMGIDFPTRVGLAAGFDKNGDHIPGLSALGFGFLEIGTVTPKPQNGQPLPRIFRLTDDKALINRMGFPNKGVDHLVQRLSTLKQRPVLGINIGKNAATSLEDAIHDYTHCLTRVYPYADYVAVNLSSPNTPGLRELQGGRYLPGLLSALKAEQARLADQTGRHVPLVVKISPDLADSEVEDIAHMLLEARIEGAIATNTTLSRSGLHKSLDQAGGLSGAPLFSASTHVLSLLKKTVGDKIALIGVGGIMGPQDAQAKYAAGADLIQVYTGLIYQGPGMVKTL